MSALPKREQPLIDDCGLLAEQKKTLQKGYVSIVFSPKWMTGLAKSITLKSGWDLVQFGKLQTDLFALLDSFVFLSLDNNMTLQRWVESNVAIIKRSSSYQWWQVWFLHHLFKIFKKFPPLGRNQILQNLGKFSKKNWILSQRTN